MNEDGLEALKICRRAPAISHLLFADDTLLFFRVRPDQAFIVREVLNTYAAATGELINPAKCSILFAENCYGTVSSEIKSILNVTQEVFEAKYLALPVPEGRMNKRKLQSLIEKLAKRLVDWSEKYMSMASKEILIKAVAQAIPTYVMSVFRLPASVCDKLTRMMRQYWWGWRKARGRWLGSAGRKRHYPSLWVAWGLGI